MSLQLPKLRTLRRLWLKSRRRGPGADWRQEFPFQDIPARSRSGGLPRLGVNPRFVTTDEHFAVSDDDSLLGEPPETGEVTPCVPLLCRIWPSLCQTTTRARQATFRFDPEGLEFQTGVLALALGGWWLLAPHTSATTTTNFGAHLVRLWPSPVWVLLFWLVGATQIVASIRRWMSVRCLCAMGGFWLWAFVAVLLALEGLPGPTLVLFPVIALSEAWVYLRLRSHEDTVRCDTNSPNDPEHSTHEYPTQRT